MASGLQTARKHRAALDACCGTHNTSTPFCSGPGRSAQSAKLDPGRGSGGGMGPGHRALLQVLANSTTEARGPRRENTATPGKAIQVQRRRNNKGSITTSHTSTTHITTNKKKPSSARNILRYPVPYIHQSTPPTETQTNQTQAFVGKQTQPTNMHRQQQYALTTSQSACNDTSHHADMNIAHLQV